MKKILVTGGAGFIGSHLCERLISLGDEVVCIDNLMTGNLDNINTLIHNPRYTFIECDITDPSVMDLRRYGFDEIYNLACPASPIHYQSNPIATTLTCTVGVNNMLRLATELNAKILQTSTSEVYGNPAIHPQHEDYFGNVNPNGIRSCYDEGKRCAESLCFDYYREYKTRIKVIRIFNTYGERMSMNDGRVIPNFITQALKGEPITIYGDGYQTRSLLYVNDLIEGMLLMMNTGDNVTGPVNIGNQKEYTINQIADIIIKKTKSESKITHLPPVSDDPIFRNPSIERAIDILKWKPSTSFNDGVCRTIEYFKNIL